ncbi:DUF2778 domain-containing protein [Bacillus sp. NP157]|nr:DUF2778 domain-containing protein [Bacillus sp. NP157]
MSTLVVGSNSFPAFSGNGNYINKWSAQCLPGLGPIPVGTYYTVDRLSGGLSAALDPYLKKDVWFALYPADDAIDDEMFCDQIMRGRFRLHPATGSGGSIGCVTLPFFMDFVRLRKIILDAKVHPIPGSDVTTYGRLIVS